jgi:dynein heavy chain 1
MFPQQDAVLCKRPLSVGRDGDQYATIMEKRIAEVEMGFLNLQQSIEIPEINIAIHPGVQEIIKKCSEENRKPKLDDYSDKCEDANFLNQLQAGVTRWVKEMKKVTKLDPDPLSGTALQEISFWINLEKALNRIQEKRESIEVQLTLEILKHGKRFMAIVSFDSDTGLKEAIETAKDHNVLMKDFPLNDLLAATDLPKTSSAIQGIFNHLKKIRSSKYPFPRVLKLIETISRDLTQQMLRVNKSFVQVLHLSSSLQLLKSVTQGFVNATAHGDTVRRFRKDYKIVHGSLQHLGRRIR